MNQRIALYVDQYWSATLKDGQTVPNVDDMTRHLRDKHPETKKLKFSSLKSFVNSAIERSKKTHLLKTESQTETNVLNNSLRRVYVSKKTPSEEKTLKKRKLDFSPNYVQSDLTFKDIGGCEEILKEIFDFIVLPIKYSALYSKMGINPPKGILFVGPSGSGKSMAAMAVANECNATMLKFSAPEIVMGVTGDSESKLRDIFQEAKNKSPCIVVFDEIDVICSSGNNQKSIDRRIVAQLVSCLDDLSRSGTLVVCVATTSKPEQVDNTLRRGGRFDREILFKAPDAKSREMILEKLCQTMRLHTDVKLSAIAHKTPGFVGADLELLVKEAAKISVRRIFADLDFSWKKVIEIDSVDESGNKEVKGETEIVSEPQSEVVDLTQSNEVLDSENQKVAEKIDNATVMMEDFSQALAKVVPGFKRDGFTSIPLCTWQDIGGLDALHEETKMGVVFPIMHPDLFRKQGLDCHCGILLYGPPGCGKTLAAKAVANEAQTSFIAVKGPELLSAYVGESEKAVRSLFTKASMSAPCIIFFDEIESLIPNRSVSNNASEVSLRVVTQFLTELDGLAGREGVFVIAATNRPDMIDKAILRPGRLGKQIYVSLPDKQARKAIFLRHLNKIPTEDRENRADGLSECCEGFSGADCANLVQRAATMALKEVLSEVYHGDSLSRENAEDNLKRFRADGITVKEEHFASARRQTTRSVSKESASFYEKMRNDLEKRD